MKILQDGLKPTLMLTIIGLALGGLLLFQRPARALPSYARQTGMACNLCHTVFPELTEFGRTFKASGYTLSQMKKIQSPQSAKLAPLDLNDTLPLSVMAQVAYTGIQESVSGTQNNDIQLPQQLSLFLAGEITPHIGSFVQTTYTQVDDHLTMDNTDLRYANTAQMSGKPLVYGLTLNNNPTVEDLWNSTPAWSFPYASADVAPTPAAGALIDGGLAQQVAGLGGYGFWDNSYYAAVAIYRSAQIGQASPPDDTSQNTINNVAPYWRLAWQHPLGPGSFEVGTYGLYAELYPSGVSGSTDQYTDYALDASYRHPLGNHQLSFHATYIYENQKLNASVPADTGHHLNTYRLDANYYLGGSVALTLAYFRTDGDENPGLYSPAPVTGSRNFKPDSEAYIAQIGYYPWQNVRLSAQYIYYDKFNGSDTNYDGFDRQATDNNTLYLMAWLVW
ncbi:MAG: hypothetical protein M0036_19605 [Desulfobacteraceae bacterium]|nr:hypothetical protein [Desulfobacteraceae bacterium]